MKQIAGGFFLGALATVIVLTGLSWHREDVAETIARAKFDQQMSDSSKELGKLADSIINDPAWCGNIPCAMIGRASSEILSRNEGAAPVGRMWIPGPTGSGGAPGGQDFPQLTVPFPIPLGDQHIGSATCDRLSPEALQQIRDAVK